MSDELNSLAVNQFNVSNQSAAILVAAIITGLLAVRYALALRSRPTLLQEIHDLLEIAGDATDVLDETLERYPQWRTNQPLAAELYRLEEIGRESAGQFLRLLFGNPLKAADRLCVLAPLYARSIDEIREQVDSILEHMGTP